MHWAAARWAPVAAPSALGWWIFTALASRGLRNASWCALPEWRHLLDQGDRCSSLSLRLFDLTAEAPTSGAVPFRRRHQRCAPYAEAPPTAVACRKLGCGPCCLWMEAALYVHTSALLRHYCFCVVQHLAPLSGTVLRQGPSLGSTGAVKHNSRSIRFTGVGR